MAHLLAFLSALFLGLLAGAMLLIATALVPYWRSLEPAEFTAWFRKYSPLLGRVMLPLGASATLFAISPRRGALRRWRPVPMAHHGSRLGGHRCSGLPGVLRPPTRLSLAAICSRAKSRSSLGDGARGIGCERVPACSHFLRRCAAWLLSEPRSFTRRVTWHSACANLGAGIAEALRRAASRAEGRRGPLPSHASADR
jgi:hypothetical protein